MEGSSHKWFEPYVPYVTPEVSQPVDVDNVLTFPALGSLPSLWQDKSITLSCGRELFYFPKFIADSSEDLQKDWLVTGWAGCQVWTEEAFDQIGPDGRLLPEVSVGSEGKLEVILKEFVQSLEGSFHVREIRTTWLQEVTGMVPTTVQKLI